jgi:Flp pilus assembly pilin Flp
MDADDMSLPLRLSRFARDCAGATAIEFGLVLPAFVLLVMGGMSAATLGYSVASLHYVVEETARCAGVKTTICKDGATTEAYARSHYSGPKISPVFTYSKETCGVKVSAQATYDLNFIPQFSDVPISASACYPVEVPAP